MSFHNQINRDLKNITKYAGILKEQIYPHKSQEFLNIEKNILKRISKVEVISELPRVIASIAELKQYQSFHMVTHERGQAYASSYSYQRNQDVVLNQYKVKDFNLIFTTIKKSKNKLFNANNLKTHVFPFIGYFLASTLKTQKVNILISISRDGFLPPEPEEIQYFNVFSNILPQTIEKLFFENKIHQKISVFQKMTESMPFPVRISDRKNKTIFSTPDHCFPVSQRYNFNEGRLELFGLLEQDSSDFFHRERIDLLGELLNTLRHELSNPLFGLKMASDLLQTIVQDDEDLSFIKHILSSSNRCESIIENFSKLYKDHSVQTDCELDKLIQETLVLTKSETKHFYPEFSNETHIKKIKANPTWLSQILFNFIVNSVESLNIKNHFHHNEQASIAVTIKMQHDKMITISVTDNGIGFDKETQTRILTPFFTTKDDGTGIGLSISKHLAHKMNGHISFTSPGINKGATFNLELPVNI